MNGLKIFLDRSVGTKKITEALRDLELDVQSMTERYGDQSPQIPDVRWIEDATRDNQVLIGADKRVRYNKLERWALCRFKAKYFTFPRGDLSASEMIRRVTRHLPEIQKNAKQPGPYVFHLEQERCERMNLNCHDAETD